MLVSFENEQSYFDFILGKRLATMFETMRLPKNDFGVSRNVIM